MRVAWSAHVPGSFCRQKPWYGRGYCRENGSGAGRQPMAPSSRQGGDLALAEAELGREHLVGVLADPRHAGLGAFGHLRQLHRVAGDEHGLGDAVGAGHLHEHVARRDVRVGDHLGRVIARARDDARPRSAPRAASSFVASTAHASTAGRITSSRCVDPARRASRSAGRRATPAWPTSSASRSNWCSRRPGATNAAVGRPEAVQISVGASRARAHAERPEVRDDVGHRDHRVEHRDVDVLALAGALAVPQRGEHADHAEERRADVAERADRDRAPAARPGCACSRRCPTSPRRSARTPASRRTASSTVLPKPEIDR